MGLIFGGNQWDSKDTFTLANQGQAEYYDRTMIVYPMNGNLLFYWKTNEIILIIELGMWTSSVYLPPQVTGLPGHLPTYKQVRKYIKQVD